MTPIGYGDHHDPRFDEWERRGDFTSLKLVDGTITGVHVDPTCLYHIHLYPTQKFRNIFYTSLPLKITVSITAVFLFTIFMFLVYDRLVERRQKVVATKASQTAAIVSSLFPKNVRDRLFDTTSPGSMGLDVGTKTRLKGFLAGNDKENNSVSPIADLFLNCTVFFADICKFLNNTCIYSFLVLNLSVYLFAVIFLSWVHGLE